jgi:hypothetical protein
MLWLGGSQVVAAKDDFAGGGGGIPLQDDAEARAIGVQVFYGSGSGAGGGEGGGGEAGGTVGGAEELDAIGEELGGSLGEAGGEGVDPGDLIAGVVGVRDGDGGSGRGHSDAGLVRKLAAELAGDGGAVQGKLVGGGGGGGEVELDGVADAGGGEVADGLGKAERRGVGRSGAGAADGSQGGGESSAAEEQRGGAAVAAAKQVHGNQPSIRRPARTARVRIRDDFGALGRGPLFHAGGEPR